ncbi:hypothetical protein [Salinadaptatus halalkaliphilus]|nr:hypothetical protein [Salinadaptatus halalkaliphilus]
MDRRTLVSFGTTVGLVSIVGCLGDRSDTTDGSPVESTDSTGDDGENDDADGDRTDDEFTDVTPSDPIERIDIVDSDNRTETEPGDLHAISVTNADTDARDLTVRIDHDGASVFDETDELPADTTLEIVVNEPGTYATDIESGSARANMTTTYSSGDRSLTTVSLREGGGISTQVETRH